MGQIEVIYDGDSDGTGDRTVDVARPRGLKSPFSGVNIGGTVEIDPSPLDVSNLFGIATVVGDWDQDSKNSAWDISSCLLQRSALTCRCAQISPIYSGHYIPRMDPLH